MRILGYDISRNKAKKEQGFPVFEGAPPPPAPPAAPPAEQERKQRKPQVGAFFAGTGIGQGVPYHMVQIYTGERNLGEFGPVKQYIPDHFSLRLRSKELYLMSDVCQAVVNKYTQWVIGRGLTLKSQPQKEVLAAEQINIDTEVFNKSVEAPWKVYANSSLPDIKGRRTLHKLCDEAFHETIVGGDMLVILRVYPPFVKIQHVDGIHVQNPPVLSFDGVEYIYPDTGNRMRNGVEIDAAGVTVAYHVRTGPGLQYTRIKAKDSVGMIRAFMCRAIKSGIDSERSMPILCAVMETAKKISSYTSAALSGAEARAKIDYAIEHTRYSDNEDPFVGRKARASHGLVGEGGDSLVTGQDLPEDVHGKQLADMVTATTNHTTVNMPNEAKLTAPFTGSQELTVEEFGMFNIKLLCAAVGIPVDVAMSEYNNSFSASRMAAKDWEHKFKKVRQEFAQEYLDPLFKLQVYVWVNTSKIQAPGFMQALMGRNDMAIEAYLYCDWIGDNFPDIDPLKTANAGRKILGASFDHIPLGTAEEVTEMLDMGEYDSNIRQAGNELKDAAAAGIKPPEPTTSAAKVDEEEEPEEEGSEQAPPAKKQSAKVRNRVRRR